MSVDIEICKANKRDTDEIMVIIEEARESIGRLGIDQWQYGYPNRGVVVNDISAGISFVARDKEKGVCAGTFAAFDQGDPAYSVIYDGEWVKNGKYIALHRFAVAKAYRGKGVSDAIIEFVKDYCRKNGFESIRIDTHYGNYPMIRMLERSYFIRCGAIYLKTGEHRVAFELPV